MKVLILASGSEGNCIYLEEDGSGLIIDAGISRKRILKGLAEHGISKENVEAVFITHEHTDHTRGLRILCKYENYPVYASEGTIEKLTYQVPRGDFRSVFIGTRINGFEISSLPLPHDAVEPVGYVIEGGGSRVLVATDLGYVTEGILREISRCQAVIFESNHDIEMLNNGSYSEDLKARILSRWGHLSNKQCAAALKQAHWGGLKLVILAHLSLENNSPELALAETSKALPGGIKVIAALRRTPTGPFLI